MKTSSLPMLLLALNLSCGGDDARFLPLDRLCSSIAETVCEARQGCCEVERSEQASCEDEVSDACDEERAELEQEDSLRYDGERAQAVHDDMRSSTRECEPPFALARFFEGSVANGAACERDAQCAQGACDEGKCDTQTLAPLCAPTSP